MKKPRRSRPCTKYHWHENVLGIVAAVRIEAKKCGYAIGLHGSLARDIDLIAVPWTQKADTPEDLVSHLVRVLKLTVLPQDGSPERKPNGRIAWSLHLLGTGSYVDLSVFPPTQPREARS